MFCKYCGTENDNGAVYCKSCGKPLGDTTESIRTEVPDQGTHNINPGVPMNNGSVPNVGNQNGNKSKKLPMNIVIIAGIIIVALITVITISINQSSTINLDKYLIIDVNGYDGYGTAKAAIDWNAIEQKYGNKVSYTNKAKSEYGGLIAYTSPVEVMQNGVGVHIDQDSNLTNGDEISYSWIIDEDLTKYIKCKVKYKDGTQKVSGLKEIGTFDAFADLKVEFSGISPDGKADISYMGSEMDSYDFKCEKKTNLSNNDKITVTIDSSKLEEYAKKLGKVPAELEKEYTVEGLDSYLNSSSDIDDSALDSMKQQGEDVFKAYAAKNWADTTFFQNLTYIGNYLLTVKNPDSGREKNALYLVYNAQTRNTLSDNGKTFDKAISYYWYIEYTNLILKSDGTIDVDLTDYSIPNDSFEIDSGINNGWWGTLVWTYYGYETMDGLYKYVVTQHLDEYNHQDNIDENAVPETVSEEIPSTVDSDYKLSKSDTELISTADLEGFTAEDCEIARNEIYARHGRKFKDATLQAYFDGKEWYEGTIEPDAFQESDLSEIEIANRDTIVQYEKDKGYR